MLQWIKAQPALLWRFLGFFQPPALRLLHAVMVSLVIVQFLTHTWGFDTAHMYLGLALSLVALALIGCGLWMRGPRNYFPYLFLDFTQLEKDIAAIRGGKRMIAPRPKGLATVVQGLGMGALSMSLLTGLWLYRGWEIGDVTPEALDAHSIFVWLMLAFMLGHGGMALGHFMFWQKGMAKKAAGKA